jgi:hypothetical protein
VKTIGMTADGNLATENVDIVQAIDTAQISIIQPLSTLCLGGSLHFIPYLINGGNAVIEWFLNNNSVHTGNDYKLNPIEIGDKVSATLSSDAACLNTNTAISNLVSLDVINCSTSSIEIIEKTFNVFPNPFTNEISVIGQGIIQIQIIDVLVKQLTNKVSVSNATTLDLELLKSGVYFLNLTYIGGSKTEKIINK